MHNGRSSLDSRDLLTGRITTSYPLRERVVRAKVFLTVHTADPSSLVIELIIGWK